MSKKNSQSSVDDQSENDQPLSPCQVDQSTKAMLGCRNKAETHQRNGETASSSPESGSLNGEGKRSGKSRRRRKRSSNPESRPEEKVDRLKNEEKPDKQSRQLSDHLAGLIGLQSECTNVWFERSIYERAESLYQCWLASSSNATTQSNRSPPSSGKRLNSASSVAPPSAGPSCHHGDQVACHHVVQTVWVNKTTFDQAERRFVEESMQPSVPNSLDLQTTHSRSTVSRTPDEGYQSLAPTPATPVIQAAITPTTRQSINGLPRIPVELLRDVWLDKPLYDRAEAAFYQNLYGNNSTKRSSCTSTSRSSDHPQSLVEEEEEEENEEVVVEETRVVPQCKAEVFHALHPIQEEEEPAEHPEKEEAADEGVHYFLHPDSERVWLDKWRYDAAENHFRSCSGNKALKKDRRAAAAEASSVTSTAPQRDKKMSAVDFLAQEKIWFDKPRYDEAERRFYEHVNGSPQTTKNVGANTILQDIARARENIQKSLAGLKTTLCNRGSGQPPISQHSQLSTGSSSIGSSTADHGEFISRIKSLELENQSLHKVVDNLRAALSKLECRVAVLEKSPAAVSPAPAPSVPYTNGTTVQHKTTTPVKEEEEEEEEEDDDDIDLFGSDEDEEAEKLKEQRLKEYAEKKAKKPAIIAKSSILLDVKPWDDETDMAKLEECVRSVQADGLLWGTSKLVPVGYGIKKLQIACVVEDDKVGTDMLEEEITKFEDYVQSVDVAAFNKI
ncbi:eukaryotic translation elongation factor 1 delta b (guanine nucleotide exchange protein) isoform X2 [Archocentrus centrarchus]|nr:elongation factor 1-delta isoform X2 [Archocentrus centrarchus]XP_030583693.1 elongation factor 1-delta isoform X2 [Archocentrus centrarchus]